MEGHSKKLHCFFESFKYNEFPYDCSDPGLPVVCPTLMGLPASNFLSQDSMVLFQSYQEQRISESMLRIFK
jgi:hypothetical protein